MKIRKVMIPGLLIIVIAGLWFAVGPRVMAGVSHMRYSEPLFAYLVEYDEVYNLETQQIENDGLLVAIQPEYRADNGSAFSEAYIQAAKAQAALWSETRLSSQEMLDVMVLFSKPLTLAEANKILSSANAIVFESGAVGYGTDGIPFAVYSKENGPLLTQTLAEIGEANRGFEPEVTEETAVSAQTPADIQGYMAVRVWVDAAGLATLNNQPTIDFVDTTPQAVRDLLAANVHWQNTPINHVSIEMPVWAYDWK